jgi:hypothetical protein
MNDHLQRAGTESVVPQHLHNRITRVACETYHWTEADAIPHASDRRERVSRSFDTCAFVWGGSETK